MPFWPDRFHLDTIRSGLGVEPWSPLALPNIALYSEAALESFSNGASVTDITNWVAGRPNFAQSTTANKPTFQASGINSLPSYRFDGVDDSVSLSGMGSQSAWTAFIVFRQNGADTGENTFFSIADYPTATNYKMLEKPAGVDGVAGIYINGNPGFSGTLAGYAGGTVKAVVVTGSASGGALYDDTGHVATNTNNQSRANDIMRLGRRGDGNYAPCDISAVGFMESVITTDDLALLWAYFASKWGTAVP